MKYRHELKYLINEGDAAIIAQRLRGVMKMDAHAGKEGYHIRSLYFDDYWDSAYEDKMGGFSRREKCRIRIYDHNDSIIRLEFKMKQGAYIAKRSAKLTPRELEDIWDGRCEQLLRRDDPVCRHFYEQYVSRVMRPKVYVDYEREPYVLPEGDVRITFDRNVRAAYPGFPMFHDGLVFHNALEPGKLIMEVKYTEFLPQIIRQLLPPRAGELTAASKYTLCREQIAYLSGGGIRW